MLSHQARRYIPLMVWAATISVIILIPLRIISYGYLPMDDALRHAAKAVSGKPWSEILVMRSDFALDPHPGWHTILGWVHHWGNCDPQALVIISIVSLMLLVSLSALPWLRRPEAWLAALSVAVICVTRFTTRLALGRPYLFVIAALITLLFLWSRLDSKRPRWPVLLPTLLLIAASAWIHGSWYLLVLPAAALLLAGLWRPAIWFAACWLAGSFLGALLTGHPWEFLWQQLRHLFTVFGSHLVTRQLVFELLPSDGESAAVLAVAAVLLWRARAPGWKPQELLSPVFLLGVLGWLLGLKVLRFWWDWGLPAITVWLALEFQKQCEQYLIFDSWRRLLVTLGLAAGLFLATTSDYESRWTWNLTNEYLSPDEPELTSWLPGDGGIIYSADMRMFNETFFKNPTAPWKYVLGFEPALMRDEDLKVFRNVVWNFGDLRAYEPWVAKMRPPDRLVIRLSGPRTVGVPNLPQLEWHYAVSGLWVGRLPQGTNTPPASLQGK